MNRREFLRMGAKAAVTAAIASTLPATAWAALDSTAPTASEGIRWSLYAMEWQRNIQTQMFEVVTSLDIHNGPDWLDHWISETSASKHGRFMAEFHVPYEIIDMEDATVETAIKDFYEKQAKPMIDIDVQELSRYSDRYQWMITDPGYHYTPDSWAARERQSKINATLSDLEKAALAEMEDAA